MMRLKDLLRNSNPVAALALEHWDYQPGSFKFWRASANYIYRFEHDDGARFLRMTHFEEKRLHQVQAEIDFLLYLAANDYPCVRPLPAKNGRMVETIEVDGITYFAVVFGAARGRILEFDEMTEEQAFRWGRSLGRLHKLSMGYRPAHHVRATWRDWLARTDAILASVPEETAARAELQKVTSFLESLPVTSHSFGLVHYDFQQDNVLWDDESGDFEVIDFDDSHYHFYAMDISAALEDVDGAAQAQVITDNFLQGYRSASGGSGACGHERFHEMLPGLRRYSDLIRFGRILRSLQDSDFPEDPPWLQRVRPRLVNWVARLREGFDRPW